MNQMLLLVSAALWVYVLFWTTYDVVLSFFALFFKKSSKELIQPKRDFVIVIPAYKEGEILFETVESSLQVDYPEDKFKVVLLAQELEDNVLEGLDSFPIQIVRTGALGSKLNALKNWIKKESFEQNSYVFILDADNRIEPNALRVANTYLEQYDVIQLERIKTPPRSPLGFLDRWNTTVGLSLSNDSRVVLGLNTFLLGSGFSLQASLYQEFVLKAEHTIAEDKALDLFLMVHDKSVGFTKTSGVHDSTVEHQKVFNNQRARWVGGKIEARRMSRELLKRNLNKLEFWDKAMHYSAPQRSTLIPLVLVVLVYNNMFSFYLTLTWMYWLPLSFSLLAIVNTTPIHFYSVDLLKSIIAVPGSVIGIVKARWFAKQTLREDFKVTPK
jgi:cellulose synthase/poly-beta-1,6-N-acetylglucosamine synthase-like glycosyltransferase